MGFFDAIGGALKGIGKVAAPIVGGALGGPLGAMAGGALSKLLGGSTQGAIQGGLAGMSAAQLREAMKQANEDRKQARELALGAQTRADRASNVAHEQFGLGAPMRDAFRVGALNFGDPTNPFTRDMFAPMRENLRMEGESRAPGAPSEDAVKTLMQRVWMGQRPDTSMSNEKMSWTKARDNMAMRKSGPLGFGGRMRKAFQMADDGAKSPGGPIVERMTDAMRKSRRPQKRDEA